MTQFNVSSPNSEVKVNTDAVEPKDYFKILKSALKKSEKVKLQKGLDSIAALIISAKELGQTSLLDKLAFTHSTILKEVELIAAGFDTYVEAKDVKAFIDKVEPRGSIKLIELERYQRIIPEDVAAKIKQVKALNLFTGFVIVFTDLSGDKHETKKDKEFIKRNRDPIVFGYFSVPKVDIAYDKLYFVADWEDKWCDLTFDAMIGKMREMGIKNAEKTVTINADLVTSIVNKSLEDMQKLSENRNRNTIDGMLEAAPKKAGLLKRLYNFIIG